MPNMELYKIFIIVAEEQNITKASERLNISQPAVTKHIKNLEHELNTILFNRAHGMQLTKQGKILFDKIAAHIRAIEEAEKSFEKNRPINFGTYATMLSKVLHGCIAQFNNENKNVDINVFTDPFNSFYERFLNYELDAIVIIKREKNNKEESNIKYIKLNNFEFCIIANNNSALCGKKITINDLKEQIVYVPRGRAKAVCEFIDILEKNGISVNSIDSVTMAEIIEKNANCVGFANGEYFKDDLNKGRVTKLDIDLNLPKTEYGIYYRKDNMNPALLNLIKIIKSNISKDK